MTHVPPTRYSSAIMTRAPWLAAMRAARTPPDPAPITNKSTSAMVRLVARRPAGGASQIVALLLHLGAEARHDFLRHFFRPRLGPRQPLVDDDRFVGSEFLAHRRLVERDHLLQLGFAEALGIEPGDLVHDLVAARQHL